MVDLKIGLTTIPAWWHCGNAHGQFMQIVWGLFIPTIHAQPHIQLVNQVLWKIMATSDNFWENYESKHVYFESKMTRSTLKKMISKDCLKSDMPPFNHIIKWTFWGIWFMQLLIRSNWNKNSLTKWARILSCMVGRQESENRHDDKVKYVLSQHCWLKNLSHQDHLPWVSDLHRLRGRSSSLSGIHSLSKITTSSTHSLTPY